MEFIPSNTAISSTPELLKLPKPGLLDSLRARRLAMEPDGMPVCCLKRAYSWLGATGVWWSSETSSGTTVLAGLVIAEADCDVEAIALKSTQLSISAGSTHWLVGCGKLMAPKCVVAMGVVLERWSLSAFA